MTTLAATCSAVSTARAERDAYVNQARRLAAVSPLMRKVCAWVIQRNADVQYMQDAADYYQAREAGRLAFAKFERVLAAERGQSFRQRLVLAINKPGRVGVESVAIREARELAALTVRATVYAANHPRGRAVFSLGGAL
jgi:hypothetical protein